MPVALDQKFFTWKSFNESTPGVFNFHTCTFIKKFELHYRFDEAEKIILDLPAGSITIFQGDQENEYDIELVIGGEVVDVPKEDA
jgi:hypothetical protein